MDNWKRFPRVVLYLTLLIALLVGASAPALVKESVSAAPMRATLRDVIISEVAWAGTAANSTHEWIELQNTTGSSVNLANWSLSDGGDINITLSGLIPAGGYYLLENNADAPISNIKADQIYSGNLNDAGEVLTLNDNTLPTPSTIDTANLGCSGCWYAGTASPNYFTMERVGIVADGVGAWNSNGGVTRNGLDANNNPINGTPHNSRLGITNIVNNPTPSVGSNIVFTITLSNSTGLIATNVNVDALLPAELTYISHSISTSPSIASTYDKNSGSWAIGTFAIGGSATLSITAKVDTSGLKTFQADVSSTEFVITSAISTVDPSGGIADLSLTLTFAKSTSVAGQVVFTIVVSNSTAAGTFDATNVEVKDLLPTGFTYVSDTGSGTYNKTSGIWTVGTLTKGSTKTLSINAKVDISGTRTNFAEIWQSDQSDPDSIPGNGLPDADDAMSVDVKAADLRLTEVVDIAGGNAVFSITVSNAGPDAATNLTVKNSKLATSYTYVSHGVTAGTYNTSTGDWTIPTLANGASATLTVTTTIPGSLAVNWAQISSVTEVDLDSIPGNCSNSVASCLEDDDASAPSADLSLTLAVNNTNPDVNTNVVFTITVSNAGVAGTTNVQVKDLLPSSLLYVSDNGGGTYNKSTGIWTVGALPNASSKSLSLTSKVVTNGIATNLAEVWRADDADPDSIPGNGSTIEDDDDSISITSERSLIINEVAWSGTAASASDEWIELYNPSSTAITISGWTIRIGNTCASPILVTLSGAISSGGYFLLEHDDNFTISDIAADQVYTGALLSDSGETLWLCDGTGKFIDAANGNGGAWPKGSGAPNFGSMERQGTSDEDDKSWVTNLGNPRNGLNAINGSIYGTPRRFNSTGSGIAPTPTAFKPPVIILPPVGRPIINEFLARPGFDWNQDGKVNVYDEFIEIKNVGNADISLSGWTLDDEQNQGSSPFPLPPVTLKVGQRMIFYGLDTNILLSDGGDTVRLISSGGKIYDSYTYKIAKVEDQSVCRLPDGYGSWYEDCVPTPIFTNSREGSVPSMPGGDAFQSPVCELPDTLPADFLFAECRGYGAGIWRAFYWDEPGWQGDQYLPANMSKWESFVE